MSKIIPFDYDDKQIRVLTDEVSGEPLWVAKDVCDVLDLKDVNRSVSKLDDDEKLILKILASGQTRNMVCINESGLYSLILRSNKPEAKTFKRWITHEVLPSIRKTGSYSVSGGSEFTAVLSMMSQQNEMITGTLSNISLMMGEMLTEQRLMRQSNTFQNNTLDVMLNEIDATRKDITEIKTMQSTRILNGAERKKIYDHVISNARDMAEEFGVESGVIAGAIFSKLKNKFNIDHYSDIPYERLGEAILFINSVDISN